MITGGPKNTSIGSAVESLITVSQTNFSSQFTLSAQKLVEQFAAGNVSCASQNSLVNLNGSTSAIALANSGSGAVGPAVAFRQVWGVFTTTTTITMTFTTTLPFVATGESTTQFSIETNMSTMTTKIPTSTLSTQTMSPTSTITPQGLVFGRCVILAVVQELGVVGAAGIQRLLQSAIEGGTTTISDAGSGIKIDLVKETVKGLTT
jgi:hypothetical protein